jgi:hypothetical protein
MTKPNLLQQLLDEQPDLSATTWRRLSVSPRRRLVLLVPVVVAAAALLFLLMRPYRHEPTELYLVSDVPNAVPTELYLEELP